MNRNIYTHIMKSGKGDYGKGKGDYGKGSYGKGSYGKNNWPTYGGQKGAPKGGCFNVAGPIISRIVQRWLKRS